MMPVSDPRFDFLAANSRTHAILGTGQTIAPTGPLPRDSGVHLVAGDAQMGELELVGTFPEGYWPDRGHSPDGRWVAVDRDDAVELFDLRGGLRRGFVFHPPKGRIRSIHPSGDLLAVRTEAEVLLCLPDGEVLRRAAFSHRGTWPDTEGMTFSACGEYLWLAHCPAEGRDGLLLLTVPGLEIADRAAVPFDPDSHYDNEEVGWRELCVFVDPVHNLLAMRRTAGDSFLSVCLASVADGRIVDAGKLSRRDSLFEADPVRFLAFSGDGSRLLTVNRYDHFCEWDRPDLAVKSEVRATLLLFDRERHDLHVESLAYAGDLVLFEMGMQLFVLESGTLAPVGVLQLMVEGRVMENGCLLCQRRDETAEVRRIVRSERREGVVLQLDSDCGLALGVWGRSADGWEDITETVLWVNPAFGFEGGE